MSKFKGTKGKWSKYENSSVFSPKGILCLMAGDNNEERLCNAQLIAHAKELLTNLEMQVDSVELSNIDFYNKYGFNVSELHEKHIALIESATTI